MKPADTEARVKYLVAELDIDTLLAKLREYELAGQRSQSMSDGRGSSESPIPIACRPETDDWTPTPQDPAATPWNRPSRDVIGTADPLDRTIREDRQQLDGAMGHLLDAAKTVLSIQRKYLNARTTDLDKQTALAKPPPGSGPCGNAHCDHTCSGKDNDRLRKSTRKGDDPAKAPIARCKNCDIYWAMHGIERPRKLCRAEKASA